MARKNEAVKPVAPKPTQHTNKDVKEFVKSSRKFGVKTKDAVFVDLFMAAK